jgi:hypothetical protein
MAPINQYVTRTALAEWAGQGYANKVNGVSLDPRIESFGGNTRLAIEVQRFGSYLTTIYAYATTAARNADTGRDVNVGSIVYGETNGPLAFWSGSAWTANSFAVATALRAALSAFASSLIIPDGLPIPGPPGTTEFSDLEGLPSTLAGYGIEDAATAAQGALADTALQAETPITVPTAFSSRSVVQRFGDTFDLRDFGFITSGAVGTETANNAALDRLIAHAATNPGMVYRGRKGDVIRLNGSSKTMPKARYRFEGGRFDWTGNLSASAAVVFAFANGADVDFLNIGIPTGGLFRRLVDFAGDNICSQWMVECESQVNNEGGNNLDFAFRFKGSRNRVGAGRTKNVDNGAIIYGDGGAGSPQVGSRYESFTFESFCKGIVGRNLTRCSIMHVSASGKSPNAIPNPGYNACQWEGLIECVVGTRQIFDAGEHNERWGGPHSGEQLTRNTMVGDLVSGRAGQCGFKIWSGLNSDTISGMTFGTKDIFNCGRFAVAGVGAAPAFNDFGVMVQNLKDSVFSPITVYSTDGTSSSFDGGYFSQCQDVQVPVFNSRKAKRNGLRVSEYNGNNSDSNDTNTLRFGMVNISEHEAEAIYLQFPSVGKFGRRISIDNYEVVGGTDVVKAEGVAANYPQPVYLRGTATSFGGLRYNGPASATIKNVDKMA